MERHARKFERRSHETWQQTSVGNVAGERRICRLALAGKDDFLRCGQRERKLEVTQASSSIAGGEVGGVCGPASMSS